MIVALQSVSPNIHMFQSNYKNREKLLNRQTSNLLEQQAEYQHRLRTCSLCNGYRRPPVETCLEAGERSLASSSSATSRMESRRPPSSASSTCSFCSTPQLAIRDCVHLRHKTQEGGSSLGDIDSSGDNMTDCQDILNYYNELIDRGQTKIPW